MACCGRFVFAFSKDELENLSRTNVWINEEKFHTSYNVAPSAWVPVVRTCAYEQRQKDENEKLKVKEESEEQEVESTNSLFDMQRVLHVMKWGLEPFWSRKKSNEVKHCINARSETLLEKNMFKVPLKAGGRGVLIANGFYEWQKLPGEKGKVPYFISDEAGPLYLAVVYDLFEDESHKEGQFTIVTVDANPSLAWLHDRMPAILKPQQLEEWLNTKKFSAEEAVAILKPFEGKLKTQMASPLVNSVKNDGEELISFKRTREDSKHYSIDSFFSLNSRNKFPKSTK